MDVFGPLNEVFAVALSGVAGRIYVIAWNFVRKSS